MTNQSATATTKEALAPCPWCRALPEPTGLVSSQRYQIEHQENCYLFNRLLDMRSKGSAHFIGDRDVHKWNSRVSAPIAPVVDHEAKAKEIVEEYKQRVMQLPSGDAVPCAKWLETRLRIALDLAAPASTPQQSEADHIADGAIGCGNCGDTWERSVAPDGTVAQCEDCGDASYSLVTPELVKLRQAIGWICDAADAAYIEDSDNQRIHEIFNIAAKAAGLTRRLPDEHGRFDETSID